MCVTPEWNAHAFMENLICIHNSDEEEKKPYQFFSKSKQCPLS